VQVVEQLLGVEGIALSPSDDQIEQRGGDLGLLPQQLTDLRLNDRRHLGLVKPRQLQLLDPGQLPQRQTLGQRGVGPVGKDQHDGRRDGGASNHVEQIA